MAIAFIHQFPALQDHLTRRSGMEDLADLDNFCDRLVASSLNAGDDQVLATRMIRIRTSPYQRRPKGRALRLPGSSRGAD